MNRDSWEARVWENLTDAVREERVVEASDWARLFLESCGYDADGYATSDEPSVPTYALVAPLGCDRSLTHFELVDGLVDIGRSA